jgi:hypothetical protein
MFKDSPCGVAVRGFIHSYPNTVLKTINATTFDVTTLTCLVQNKGLYSLAEKRIDADDCPIMEAIPFITDLNKTKGDVVCYCQSSVITEDGVEVMYFFFKSAFGDEMVTYNIDRNSYYINTDGRLASSVEYNSAAYL